MLFYISLFITIVVFFKSFFKSLKLGYALTLHYILPLCFVVFIYINPIVLESDLRSDENFNFLIFLGVLGMLFTVIFLPYDFTDPHKNWNKQYIPKYEVKKTWMNFGTLIYLLYLFYEIINKIISAGSFSAVFTINRLEKGLGEDYLGGNGLFIVMLFFRILYYIKTYYLFSEKKYFKFVFLYIIPMLHHLMTAVTRFDFVIMFIALVFLIIDEKFSLKDTISKLGQKSRIRKKLSAFRLGIYVVPFLLLLFSYMQFANNIRSGLGSGESSEESLDWLEKAKVSAAIDLNYYNFLNRIYNEIDKERIDFEYGKSWFYYPVLNFIPRNLWVDKPLTAFSPRYTEKIYYKLGTGNPVVTFSILGEGYVQFGLFGVFLTPILFGFSRYIGISILKRIKGIKILLFLTLLSLITYFRGEQPMFYVFLETIYALIILSFFSRRIIITPQK